MKTKKIIEIPRYAKVVKGAWKTELGYGDVWCKIREIHIHHSEMCLIHPKYDDFAWVLISDCVLK